MTTNKIFDSFVCDLRSGLGGTVFCVELSSTVPRDGTEAKRGSIGSFSLPSYLHIPSILTSVAFKTSLSFSFVMLPVTVT
jgi:hypothetical protein